VLRYYNAYRGEYCYTNQSKNKLVLAPADPKDTEQSEIVVKLIFQVITKTEKGTLPAFMDPLNWNRR